MARGVPSVRGEIFDRYGLGLGSWASTGHWVLGLPRRLGLWVLGSGPKTRVRGQQVLQVTNRTELATVRGTALVLSSYWRMNRSYRAKRVRNETKLEKESSAEPT